MKPAIRPGRLLSLALAALLPGLVLPAATYLPISDADLALRAPVIVRASVLATSVRVDRVRGEDLPFTIVTLQRLEAFKGAPGETFTLRVPGGRAADLVWTIPGAPVFAVGEEVVLMLSSVPGQPGEYRLTELGLSRFSLAADSAGQRFAVRPAFSLEEDLVAARRDPAGDGGAARGKSAPVARDAESFLSFLRAVGRGETAPEILYGEPSDARGDGSGTVRSKWANLGGREPGDGCGDTPCLWRWFWDTGASPSAVLNVSGTQTNLIGTDEPTCGTDSNCDVQNAAAAWHGVSGTDIRLSGPSSPGNVTVNLDATSSQDNGTTWSTALGCTGGVIGLGGPGSGTGPRTYRGDATYYSPSSGTVSMRKVTCASGYSAATFRSAVLHEVGHVIGLNHPDQAVSIHSTTTSTDYSAAVMHSVIAPAKPDTPQTDDLQAVRYYYGTGSAGAPPVANFTYSPSAPTTGASITFNDSSTGGATGWNWDFGDSTSSSNTATTQSASHVFTQARTYTVTLTAGSLSGSNSITKQVTVAPGASTCTQDANTLCLNGNRFKVTIDWQKPDSTSGHGTGVKLTGDSGYFWFFDRSNIESVVKVLNACGVNTHYWVFAAGLTNVKATLTVVDTSNGTVQQYVNPQGTAFAPIQDTSAFATCP